MIAIVAVVAGGGSNGGDCVVVDVVAGIFRQ